MFLETSTSWNQHPMSEIDWWNSNQIVKSKAQNTIQSDFEGMFSYIYIAKHNIIEISPKNNLLTMIIQIAIILVLCSLFPISNLKYFSWLTWYLDSMVVLTWKLKFFVSISRKKQLCWWPCGKYCGTNIISWLHNVVMCQFRVYDMFYLFLCKQLWIQWNRQNLIQVIQFMIQLILDKPAKIKHFPM